MVAPSRGGARRIRTCERAYDTYHTQILRPHCVTVQKNPESSFPLTPHLQPPNTILPAAHQHVSIPFYFFSPLKHDDVGDCLSVFLLESRTFGVVSQLKAEWAPKEGKWEEKDYEGQMKKLEAEAEERLDEKISEMMRNIENVGKSS